MIMGGNQPYFIPYIGYWQLINAVDVFMISDDYNYIDGGWVNRNRILEKGIPKYFNIEISHATSNKKINDLYIASKKFSKEKKLMQLRHAYRRAPHFSEGYILMQKIFDCKELNLAGFLENSIKIICEYLEIKTKIYKTSSVPHNCELKKEYRIFDQCKYIGADVYINAIGGREIYSSDQFMQEGIQLGFIKTNEIRYKQLRYEFVPNLSIIDVIMFNSKDEIKKILQQYTILWDSDNLNKVK